jgi:extracellular factor (EF) 3-hydroxypalmitic acid methyl ester biosynthesis protein
MNFSVPNSETSKLDSVVQFFANDVGRLNEKLAQLESEIDPNAVPVAGDEYHKRVVAALDESQVACKAFTLEHLHDAQVLKDVRAGFLTETDRFFKQSWLGNRARTKPNGFVGDYEMLRKLYDEVPPSRGLGGYIDLWILDLPLARAVRTRLKSARAFLLEELAARKGDVRILDVASGPCREFHDWPTVGDRKVSITAMDTCPEALNYVGSTVVPIVTAGTTLKPVRYNALRTTNAETTVKQFGKFDVIYSVGLCDYLTDDQLVRLFSAWRDTLDDDGVMLVAFKDTEQYDHSPYQWHLDWYFYQRTVSDVLRLYEQSGISVDEIETSRDGTGIITNFVSRKVGSVLRRRTDSAESIKPNLNLSNTAAAS